MLHQKTIASELWSFLNQCSPESLSPALDLIACLSCDLRVDFYDYIDQFLPDIFRIILENYQNADILQSSFNCLAHIVYFLHKPMLLDVQNTMKLFTPLLVNKTKHIPHFAAECLAFVLRKVSDRRMLLFQVWRAFEERLDLMGILLREVMCGSNGKLHSIAYELLPLVLDIVCKFDTNALNTRASNIAQAGVRKGLQNILKKCPVSDTIVHVQCTEEKNKFLAKLPAILKVALSSLCAEFIDTDEIRYIINLVTERFELMKEKFKEDCFENMVSILACLQDSIKRENFANLEDSYGQAFGVALSVHSSVPLLTCFSRFVRQPFRRYNPFTTVRNVLLSNTYSAGHRMNFILDLSDWTLFDRDVLPSLGDFLGQLTDPDVRCEEPACRHLCGFFDFFLHLSIARLPPSVEPCGLLMIDRENSLCIHLHEKRPKITAASLQTDQPVFVNWILNALENLIDEQTAKLETSLPVNPFRWILAFCLPYISHLPMDRVCRILYLGWKMSSDKIIRGEYHFDSCELTFDLLSLLILVETRSHFRSLIEEVEPLLRLIESLTKMAR
ncbi:hypothetical protein PHET_06768 [Paragonimus heterotremus]|uniref:Uncharacterized protein n=1 Tax=Paragonimus heterotremus TaxID=100268 RepID=A0A8J4TIR3_9TREM|nr:hypothetical protein PHET_06768 [Paragonimus heterotremus]